jgi:hypothetical protein
MDLYTKEMIPQIAKDACRINEATLSDVRAYLAERRMAAVPLEPTKAMMSAVHDDLLTNPEGLKANNAYRIMVKAAQGPAP